LDTVEAALKNEATRIYMAAFFDKNLTLTNLSVDFMRTIYAPAGPLEIDGVRYRNSSSGDGAQTEYFKSFAKMIGDESDDNFKEADIGFLIRSDSFVLTSDEFLTMAIRDGLMSIFAVFFVFGYLNIHLKSCFLSFIGIMIILFSFPVTVFITNMIL
jgi:hypothetical protein